MSAPSITSKTETQGGKAPSFREFVWEFFLAFDSSWRPGSIVLFWAALIPGYVVHRLLGPDQAMLHLAVGLVEVVVFLAIGCAVAGAAGWEYGQRRPLTLRQAGRMLRARARSLYLAVLFAPLATLTLVFVLSLGSLVNLIPGIGDLLAVVWLTVVGIPVGCVVSCVLLLGIPATFLMLPAAALDFPDPFDVASRAISYVRGRSGSFLILVALSGLRALFAAALTAVFVLVLSWTVITAFLLGDFNFDWVIPHFQLLQAAPGEISFYAWEIAVSGADAASTVSPVLLYVLSVVSCLVPASFLSALASSSARTYLYLRWVFDQEPPSALVRPDESFKWDE